MKTKKSSLICGSLWTLLLILFDQWTKYLAAHHLAGTSGIPLISGVFELFYLENTGAAFGMMDNLQWIFILIAVCMAAAAGYFYVQLPQEPHYHGLRLVCVLITAGAIGNMIDRIIHHYVIDFLYFSLIDFPVFNVADCYICIGAVFAVLLLFTVYKDEEFDFLHSKNSKNTLNKTN